MEKINVDQAKTEAEKQAMLRNSIGKMDIAQAKLKKRIDTIAEKTINTKGVSSY